LCRLRKTQKKRTEKKGGARFAADKAAKRRNAMQRAKEKSRRKVGGKRKVRRLRTFWRDRKKPGVSEGERKGSESS